MSNGIQKSNKQLCVVGVGASAGGVSALQAFFADVTIEHNLCYLILLHSTPKHKTILAELLNVHAKIPAQTLSSGTILTAGNIYVIPENSDVGIKLNQVFLTKAKIASCKRAPIDLLFTEIAQNYGEHSAAVILSGTGCDGSQGAIKIKEAGGIVAAQDIQEAKYIDMPNNVIITQQADIIAQAKQINIQLNEIFREPIEQKLILPQNSELDSALDCIFNLLKTSTSHDFSDYKHNTLIRRIKRRMLICHIHKLADYVALLIRDELERNNLFAEILIGVTQFFRDPEVWQILAQKVLPSLLTHHIKDKEFRAWVAGCATGEEVYSLAILLYQLKQEQPQFANIHIQLFASDLNQRAIAFARKAHYGQQITSNFSALQLDTFFSKDQTGYQVNKAIRDMVVFAPHNVLSDPPFTKLDLICCRNVMIYMTPAIHEQLISKFHYSLNPTGYLMLGTAESIGHFNQHFKPIAKKVSLFERQVLVSEYKPTLFTTQISSFDKLLAPQKQTMKQQQPDNLQQAFEQHLQQSLAPAAVLVDNLGKILNLVGDTSPFIAPVSGKADWHVQSMVKPDIAGALQEALLQAQQQHQSAEAVVAIASSVEQSHYVLIRAVPFEHLQIQDLWLIAFHQFNTQDILPAIASTQLEQRHQQRLKYLEQSLRQAHNELQNAKEEMQTSREELMSSNEELQSTNEELTTSTEELRTMNDELQLARYEAEQAFFKFSELFDAAPVGYFTLDKNAKIISVNRAGRELLAESTDEQVGGRLTLYIVEQDRQHFLTCLHQAYKQDKEQNCEVAIWCNSVELRYALVIISPPDESQHCRVIVNEITERKIALQKLTEQQRQLSIVLEHSDDLIFAINANAVDSLCFAYANQKFLQLFQLTDNALENVPLAHLTQLPAQLRDSTLFLTTLNKRKTSRTELKLAIAGQNHIFEMTITAAFNEQHSPKQFVVTLHDITQMLAQQKQLAEDAARYARILNGTNDGLWEWDIAADKTYISPRWKALLGFQADELTAPSNVMFSRIHDEDKQSFKQAIAHHLEQDTVFNLELRLKTKSGAFKWFLCKAEAIRDEHGTAQLLSGTLSDIHLQKLLQQQEQSKNKILELTAKNAPLFDILALIIDMLEHDHPELLCSIIMLNEAGTHLSKGIAPRLPQFYNNALLDIAIGEGVGSCGTAAYRKQQVIVDDIQTDPLWQNYKHLAAQAGLASCWSQPVLNNQGKVLATFAVYQREIASPNNEQINLLAHQAVLAEIAIEHSQAIEQLEMASLVYENSSEASMVFDANDNILSINPAFSHITGYNAEDIIGQNREILRSASHDDKFYRHKSKILTKTGKWQGELWGRKKNGELYAQWMTINTVYDDFGRVARRVALFFDITEKKRSEQLIWQHANYDALTGLPNRRMFFDRLQFEMKRAHREREPFALLLIDLDNFKEINDAYGHDQGDKLLIEVTHRIQALVRESDTFARLGGDEFTLILTNTPDHQGIETVVQQILNSLQIAYQLDDAQAYVSASVGITLFPDDGENSETLLKNADQAMYQAKDYGKNQFSYFTPSMQQQAQQRIELINELRLAIEQQQFELYYQPIVNVSTQQINKAEALIRWNHPSKGVISPLDFIPLAEQSGLIVELGNWVFNTAIKQLQYWLKQTKGNFSLSINVSPLQFLTQADILTEWVNELAYQKLAGEHVILEITESTLLDSNSRVKQQFKLLKDANIQISMDDFGTGYSSLSYLKKFNIDFLKIDKSFIKNMVKDEHDLVLCQAIIVMAHQLKIKVIAEGVETEQQAELLKQANCDYFQGYLYQPPMPSDKFEAYVNAHNASCASIEKIKHS